MINKEILTLKKEGWVEFISDSTNMELISIASQIGNILKHPNGEEVFELKPKLKKDALTGTFSNRYGLKEFPLHTDTAFYDLPARYLLMHSADENTCNTTLIRKKDFWNRLTASDIINAKRAVYLVSTNNKKYFTNLMFNVGDERGMRFDSSCMKPYNKSAKLIDEKLKNVFLNIEPVKINWVKGKTVIIDNWNNLHGRSSAENDMSRVLKRIYIY